MPCSRSTSAGLVGLQWRATGTLEALATLDATINRPARAASPVRELDRFVLLGCVGAAVTAGIGLVSYAPGLQELGSIRPDLVPMAPSSAAVLLVLAAIVARHTAERAPLSASRISALVAALVVAFGALVVIGTLTGTTLTLEDQLFPESFTITGIRVGRMSILTGITTVLLGTGVLLLVWRSPVRRISARALDISSTLGLLAAVIGGTDLLAYLYGTPLLYGGTAVPMAATTALAFMLLGAATVASAGLDAYPTRLLVGTSTNARLSRAVLPLVAVLALAQGVIDALFRFDNTLALAAKDVVVGLGATLAVAIVVRSVGARLDASERLARDSATALRDSEERLRTLLDLAPIAIHLSREGIGTFANHKFVELFGLRGPDRAVGQPVAEFFTEPFRAESRERTRRRALGEPVLSDFESIGQRADGTEFPMHVTVEAVKVGDDLVSFAFVADLTERTAAESERLRLEAELAQAQRLESVGRLAGGIAHDFNNMLSVILGNVEYTLDHVDPTTPMRAHLLEIDHAARRSAELTHSLLAFARAETVAPAVLDLNTALGPTITLLRRLIGEDVVLDWRPGPHLWRVHLDPSQLDRVLTNLCINARDAIDGVGTVTVATTNAVIDAEFAAAHPGATAGDHVRLSVADTGSGMSPEVIAHAFEPFYTTKPVGSGTGLGLATVYGVVRQSGGFITVESQPGAGSTFAVYLPRHMGHADEPVAAVRRAPALGGHETILVVEDEPAILQLVIRTLTGRGYTVIGMAEPAEAIAFATLSGTRIDALVTDVVMPGMSGPDLARTLLAGHPHLRRVFMSGYADRPLGDEDAQFIGKPFAMDDLALKVRAALDTP